MAVKAGVKPAFNTIDEAILYMAEGLVRMEEGFVRMEERIAASNERTDRLIAASNERTDRLMAESNAERDMLMAESRAERNRLMAESRAERDRLMAESKVKTDLAILRTDCLVADLQKTVKNLSIDAGNVSHKLGEITEIITVPGIRREINNYGHAFKRSTANKKIKADVRGNRQVVAEVDLFLYNGTEVMAVEVKTTLSAEDVNAHLDRMKKLRDYEKEADLQGKKLYGAVIGIFIDDHARKLALKNGLYVLTLLEDERLLGVAVTKARVW